MDVIDLDRRAAAAMAAVIGRTRSEQYDAPTPCPDWTVRDVMNHAVAANVKYTEIANGCEWTRGAPEVDLGDDPLRTYRETVETLLEAWQRPGTLDREIDMPVGRGRADGALYLHLGETLVHGWDLATATGQRLDVDREVVEASLAQYLTWLPPQRPEGVPFSDAHPIGPDAAPIDRLAAYLGRDVNS